MKSLTPSQNYETNQLNLQVANDLLAEPQSTVFIEMVRDIIRQLKNNPDKIPVPSVPQRRNLDKVSNF